MKGGKTDYYIKLSWGLLKASKFDFDKALYSAFRMSQMYCEL